MRGYYFITDSKLSRKGNISDVKSALAAGVKIVQYREKNLDTFLMYQEALKLRKLCRDITFIVNDRLDLALAV
ncbi:MAG TPA: thiamine phosphate synthase, partial [Candidatus Margulisiibacteriota bacterium]|nr:thiamine phosphate synthase [Candidatus Margulisiibacteriota bacterium]